MSGMDWIRLALDSVWIGLSLDSDWILLGMDWTGSIQPTIVYQWQIECRKAPEQEWGSCCKCKNDFYDALNVCHAEKGTVISLHDDLKDYDFGNPYEFKSDVVKIKFQKDFTGGCGYPLKIQDLHHNQTTEYYKTEYRPKQGRMQWSEVGVLFRNRRKDFE